MTAARSMLPHQSMRVLEARFHPQKRDRGPAVVVGRVYCEGSQVHVQPAGADADPGPIPACSAMEEKLRYLVRITGKPIFQHLRELRSDYWSFVEVDAEQGRPAADGAGRTNLRRGGKT